MEELNDRYGDLTAHYGVQITKNDYIDSALKRGVGSLANTNGGHNNAKFSINPRNHSASLKATRAIKAGQEIYLAYGRSYKLNEGSRALTKKYPTKY